MNPMTGDIQRFHTLTRGEEIILDGKMAAKQLGYTVELTEEEAGILPHLTPRERLAWHRAQRRLLKIR